MLRSVLHTGLASQGKHLGGLVFGKASRVPLLQRSDSSISPACSWMTGGCFQLMVYRVYGNTAAVGIDLCCCPVRVSHETTRRSTGLPCHRPQHASSNASQALPRGVVVKTPTDWRERLIWALLCRRVHPLEL